MSAFAFIGFGELATAFAEGLRRAGVEDIRAYSRPQRDPGSARALKARVEKAQVRACPSLEEALAGARVIFAAVPASASSEVAARCAPFISTGSLYVDTAPSSPAAKEEAATAGASRGVLHVDAAVLGTVAMDGSAVPILASGPGAESFRDIVGPLGMNVTVIEGPAGRATLVKLLRSVYMKGRDALILEMVLAASRHGVEGVVLESIKGSGEQVPFPALAERVVCSLALHAGRRADELQSSTELLRQVAVDPVVSEAGSQRLRWMAELGTREYFRSERPRDLHEVLAAISALSKDPAKRSADAEGPA